MSNSIQTFHLLQESLNRLVLGQDRLIERLLISMLADGHLLVEGAPGLAKTRFILAPQPSPGELVLRLHCTPPL